MRVMIMGCGYVGLELGRRMREDGHEVFGVRRSGNASTELELAGVRPVMADITKVTDIVRLPKADWVVNLVSSSHGDATVYKQIYVEGSKALLTWAGETGVQRYVHTSSTSVYAQNDGSIVTESSPATGASETGQALVLAERLVTETAARLGLDAMIARPSGIYGPGRGFLFQKFLAGEARMTLGGKRFINMIHRDDLAVSLMAILANGKPLQIYNINDDEPVTQREFFKWLAERLGRGMPPEAAPEEEAKRKRGVTNKRVSNERLRTELGVELQYPTFREGYENEILRLA